MSGRWASVEERFWPRVQIGQETECWPWLGRADGRSEDRRYGRIEVRIDGIVYHKAHRVAYRLAKGPIPKELALDHLCANPLCCNPAHLEPVTLAENNRRAAWREGRCRRGHDVTNPGNVRSLKGGWRRCAICAREDAQASKKRCKARRAA